ncbi:acyltransferase domain-containing protein, partial [Streptomyces sp. NPDC058953]|uniref:acyltransferase domain-containing protein n=1 Tax=Streptomyces sp. NPDC058953 TaxID=3346676 RepID=UPI00367BD404
TAEDAAVLVGARSRLMQALPEGGAMVAVEATRDEIAPLLERWRGRVSIAAVNGPRATVLSGDDDAVLAVAHGLAEQGRRTRRLTVSHAFHSVHMEGMLADFHEIAAGLTYHAPEIPHVSTVTGELADATLLGGAEYWTRQIRETVRFADGLRALAGAGAATFVEVGPGGALSAMTEATLDGVRGGPLVVPLTRRDRPETDTLVTGLGRLHAAGVPVDWRAFFAGGGARRTDLPTYAFQRERYWADPDTGRGPAEGPAGTPTGHPLLGVAVELAGTRDALFTGRVSARTPAWFGEDTADGSVVVSPGAFVELAAQAGRRIDAPTVERLTLRAPLVLPAGEEARLQVRVGAPGSAGARSRTLAVHARADSADTPWTLHAEGVLGAAEEPSAIEPPPAGTAVAVRLPDRVSGDPYGLHPALWDGALRHHPFTARTGTVLLPVEWRGVRIHSAGAGSVRALLTVGGEHSVAVRLEDEHGELVATADSVGYREVPVSEFAVASGTGADAPCREVGGERANGAPAPPTAPDQGSLVRRLAGTDDEEERYRIVLDLVRTQVADVLGHGGGHGEDHGHGGGHGDPASIGTERPFQDMGFDSLTAVDLRNRIRTATGLPLSATLVFDHPTPAALVRHLLALTAAAEPPRTTSVLSGLARLEAAVSAAGPGTPDRAAVTERLRALLAALAPATGDGAPAEPPAGIADAGAADRLACLDRA